MNTRSCQVVVLKESSDVALMGFGLLVRAAMKGGAVCLAGGTTPFAMYQLFLKVWNNALFSNVHFFFSDDCAPLQEKNMFDISGLASVVQSDQVHRIKIEGIKSIEALCIAAAEYSLEFQSVTRGRPFKTTFLGAGDDGHFASVLPEFPGFQNPLWTSREPYAAVQYPGGAGLRLSITPRAVENSDQVILMATGEAKAEVLRNVLSDMPPVQRVPVRHVVKRKRTIVLLDEAAASLL